MINAGVRSQANVSLIDLPATILSLIGEEVPADMHSIDLSPTFQGDDVPLDDGYRFSEHKVLGDWHNAVDWRLVTDNHFKYVWNRGDMDELYDLHKDPYELENLIANSGYDAEQERLKARLYRWMVETGDSLLGDFLNETGLEV